MKKVCAINGSLRENKNTATLLGKVLGVKDAFAFGMVETEQINLYDLQYTGCRSCFACKFKGGTSYGRCGSSRVAHLLHYNHMAAPRVLWTSSISLHDLQDGISDFDLLPVSSEANAIILSVHFCIPTEIPLIVFLYNGWNETGY